MSGSLAEKADYMIAFSAIVFLLLIGIYLATSTSTSKPGPRETHEVVVATRNLELGTLIRHSDVKIKEWTGSLPLGTATKTSDVVGRGVMALILENEPVVENDLAPRGAGAGLADTIRAGMQAVAVPVNEVVGVAGFVVPGMRVDVLISGNPPGGSTTVGMVSKTLLRNTEVLSAGQNFQKDAEGKPVQVEVVNLLVTPAQAELLKASLNNKSRVYLVVSEVLSRRETSDARNGVMSSPEASKPAAGPSPEVEVLRQVLNAKDEAERSRQDIERQRVAFEAQRERLRDYTRIVLSLFIMPTCMFVVLHKSTTTKQKAIAATIVGALVAFWFAAPK